jgi:hypothetical protein
MSVNTNKTKCNINVQISYVKLEGVSVHAEDLHKYKGAVPRCAHGHELVLAYGPTPYPHFRHKHRSDMDDAPVSNWYAECHGHFPVKLF